jgi:hypothetical protein
LGALVIRLRNGQAARKVEICTVVHQGGVALAQLQQGVAQSRMTQRKIALPVASIGVAGRQVLPQGQLGQKVAPCAFKVAGFRGRLGRARQARSTFVRCRRRLGGERPELQHQRNRQSV